MYTMVSVKPQPCYCGLTHWGRVMHICVSKLTIIGSDNDLSPGRRQAIIWTNAGILLMWPLWINFSGILIEINTSSFKKMHLKMSSAKWRPFCPGGDELKCAMYAATNTGMTQHQLDTVMSSNNFLKYRILSFKRWSVTHLLERVMGG